MKTCYYKLLEIDESAETKDIERAYKKMAIKLHPDKNRDRDTTEEFQAVQEAYRTLSDPHERQWYDDHRDQILSGKTGVGSDVDEDDYDYLTPGDI